MVIQIITKDVPTSKTTNTKVKLNSSYKSESLPKKKVNSSKNIFVKYLKNNKYAINTYYMECIL